MKIAGAPVEDAADELVITVTKKDVQNGSIKNSRSCAVARALIREKGFQAARVHVSRSYVKVNGKWRRYNTPAALRTEVVAFDRGGQFTPGEYRLTPVQPTARLDTPAPAKSQHRRVRRQHHVLSGVRDQMKADWE
jgi:hypothetical protein